MNWITKLSHRTYQYRSIVALIIGIAVLFVPNNAMNTLVILIGVFILLAGLGTAIGVLRSQHNLFLSVGGTASIVSFVVGLLLIIYPSFFVRIMVVVMGILFAIIGLFQLINIRQMSAYIKRSKFYYFGSILTLLIGLTFLLFPYTIQSFMGILIGIALIIYALNELGIGFRTKKHMRNDAQIEDATFEEIN